MTNSIKPCHDVPDYLLPFLTDSGSLTKKLKLITGDATVKVISREMKSLDWWSQFYLKLECETLFQREIIMTSNNYSCWYARSYVPSSTWYVYATFFEQLANKNLGDMLFDNPLVQRVSSKYFSIDNMDLPYYWIPKDVMKYDHQLWLRLSVFSICEQGVFYLIELFLPELEKCLLRDGLLLGD